MEVEEELRKGLQGYKVRVEKDFSLAEVILALFGGMG